MTHYPYGTRTKLEDKLIDLADRRGLDLVVDDSTTDTVYRFQDAGGFTDVVKLTVQHASDGSLRAYNGTQSRVVKANDLGVLVDQVVQELEQEAPTR